MVYKNIGLTGCLVSGATNQSKWTKSKLMKGAGKEITLTFSAEELRELAKQLYLGGYFLISHEYDNQEMVNEIMNRVCATGLTEAPDLGAFEKSGPYEDTLFTISKDVDEECGPLIRLFEDNAITTHLPNALADRDFVEQYGKLEEEEIIRNEKLLNALLTIQNKYKEEFKTYGVLHLRLD